MTPRPLLHEDEESIAILEGIAFAIDPWSAAAVAEEIRRPGACGLGLQDGQGGWMGYALGWSIAGEAELLRIAIHPDHRGHGLGGLLLRAFVERASGQGAEAIHLEVREDNAPAIALYEREGFVLGHRRRDYYQDGCAARLYRFDAAPKPASPADSAPGTSP